MTRFLTTDLSALCDQLIATVRSGTEQLVATIKSSSKGAESAAITDLVACASRSRVSVLTFAFYALLELT